MPEKKGFGFIQYYSVLETDMNFFGGRTVTLALFYPRSVFHWYHGANLISKFVVLYIRKGRVQVRVFFILSNNWLFLQDYPSKTSYVLC